MASVRSVAAFSLCSLLAACGGGGEKGGGGSVPATFTLSGTVSAAGGQAADGDTADPNATPRENDTPGTALAVPSAVTIGGWADATADELDLFRANLAAGQAVTLAIADAVPGSVGPDLDLLLFQVGNTMDPVASSEGDHPVETLTVPTPGEYLVAVKALAGGSAYTLTLGVADAAVPPPPGVDREFVPGEVVVRFRSAAIGAASADGLAARAAALGLVPIAGGPRRPALLGLGTGAARARALARLGVEPAKLGSLGASLDPILAEKQLTLRALKAIRARADVESADPNYVFHPSAVPDDPDYRFQWHYPLIGLPQAWDVTTGTPSAGSVIVAVVDTGVFLAHPDLQGQLVAGYDFIADPARARDADGIDPLPDDPGDGAAAGASSWHGTHVSGTVAALSNEGAGAAGVSWGAKVMPLRVLGVGGGTSYDILQGVRYAAGLSNDSGTVPPRRADVVNLSLSCQGCFSATEQAVYAEVRGEGVIVVAAAGNQNTNSPGYPASYPGIVSVSAVDMLEQRAPYSNLGRDVDLAAPGGNTGADLDGNGYGDGVLSAIADDSTGERRPAWAFYQGTSMASPHVAGVVALMKAVCPELTPAQLDALIASGRVARDLGGAGRDDVYGYGLVDALAAVQAAQETCGQVPAAALQATPSRLDFGPEDGALPLTLAKVGEGELRVESVSIDVPWLHLAEVDVDPETGLGARSATVDRTALAEGSYAASIAFDLTSGATVTVPVTLQVGAAAGASDLGFLYVLLLDPGLKTVAQDQGAGTAGSYGFAFPGVPAGSYFVIAGTDLDADGSICDDGEACGAWPTLGVPTPVEVTGDRAGLDFTAGFQADLSLAAGSGNRQGYRLIDRRSVAPR